MRLFLVRHGETVDNVASIYAGSRDSALTAHGVLQVRRLGEHLSKCVSLPACIYSSDLQRAVQTAEAISSARNKCESVHQFAELREKHFGTGEGVKFVDLKKHHGAETVMSMRARVDAFLDNNLLPLLGSRSGISAVIIVSHGLLLSTLFDRLCSHIPHNAVAFDHGLNYSVLDGSPATLPWSNTGYLDASLTMTEPVSWTTLRLHVHKINSLDHLNGLRRTRGGIGSAKFDERQTTIDSFFTTRLPLSKNT